VQERRGEDKDKLTTTGANTTTAQGEREIQEGARCQAWQAGQRDQKEGEFQEPDQSALVR